MKRIIIVLMLLLLQATEPVLGQNAKKIVLLEQFTNTLCPSCGYRNPELYEDILTIYDAEIIHIAYHNRHPLPADPFYRSNPTPTEVRTNYYEISASPSIVVNGVKLRADKPLLSTEQLEKELNQTSPLQLTIEETVAENNEREIAIKTEISADLPDANYKLFVAVVEKDVFFCTYFEYIFDNVFRTFLSDNSGDDINLTNNEKNYTYQYSPQADWDEEQLFVVAFVQNIETKEIINATLTQPINRAKTFRYADPAFSMLSSVYDDVCGKNDGAIELDICVDTAPMEEPVNLSFEWSNGASSQNISKLSSGMYSVKIKDNIHQTTTEQQYEVIGNEKINVAISTEPDTGTDNGIIQVQANGGSGELSIEWNTNDDDFNLQGLQAGLYSFTVNDEKGCTYQQTVEVKSEPLINIGSVEVEVQNISCAGKKDGLVNISTTGDIAIHKVVWFFEKISGSELNNLAAGNYLFVTLDEDDNQLHEGSFVVAEPDPIELIIQQSNGFEEPYINLDNIIGGTPPYRYGWSTGSTDARIDSIEPGSYAIELTDSRGCKQSKSVVVTQNTHSVQQISCFGANDGSIEITINDGLDYSFNWTSGEKQSTINNLSAGRYGLTVMHKDNSHFLSFDIVEPNTLSVALQYNSTASPALIEPDISGGTPPYQFLWNTSSDLPIVENPENGLYSLNITDANDCINEASIEIDELSSIYNTSVVQLAVYPNPVKSIAYVDLPVSFKQANVQLFDAKGVKQGIAISIANSQLQVDVSALSTGVYILQVEHDELTYIAKTLVWR